MHVRSSFNWFRTTVWGFGTPKCWNQNFRVKSDSDRSPDRSGSELCHWIGQPTDPARYSMLLYPPGSVSRPIQRDTVAIPGIPGAWIGQPTDPDIPGSVCRPIHHGTVANPGFCRFLDRSADRSSLYWIGPQTDPASVRVGVNGSFHGPIQSSNFASSA